MVSVLVVEHWGDWREQIVRRLQEQRILFETPGKKSLAEHSRLGTYDAYIINSHLPTTGYSPMDIIKLLLEKQNTGTQVHYLSYNENARTAARQAGVQHVYDKNKGYNVLDEVVRNILMPAGNGK